MIDKLACPVCAASRFQSEIFAGSDEKILEGVLICRECAMWYPIEDSILELLPPELSYKEDRTQFAETHRDQLAVLGLTLSSEDRSDVDLNEQVKQQEHSDWYADNSVQTYKEYAESTFWQAADMIAFKPWRQKITEGWLLDLGCANGRSTFKVADLPVKIIGFDISKKLVKQAVAEARTRGYDKRCHFMVADGSALPFVSQSFDYVLVYGVLHHMPDVPATCREIDRVLNSGGIYFGQENNNSAFRKVFDMIQKLRPQWYEEAGAQPLADRRDFAEWFKSTDIELETKTSVILPPHLLNLASLSIASWFLRISDLLLSGLPVFRHQGGLILVEGRKRHKS